MRYLIFVLLFNLSLSAQVNFDASGISKFQADLNESFRDPNKSPLPPTDLASFKGLDFFPVNPHFVVTAKVILTPNEAEFEMVTTTDRLPKYIRYAILEFPLDAKTYRINVYRSVDLQKKKGYENYLFLPFSDWSNGKESYIGGRYIELTVPDSDTITIDFNKAYNPYCAYNSKYSCPRVPLENDLPTAILAGVKKYHD